MRPLNLGETLDASIKIVTARWKTLATVMLVIALPLEIANILIISSTTDVYQAGTLFSTSDTTKTTYSDSGAYAAGQVAILALTFLSYFIGNVACYRAIADTYLQRETSARDSLSFAAGRLGATLWLTILLVLGIFLGFLFLILPGIWLLIAWSVALPVLRDPVGVLLPSPTTLRLVGVPALVALLVLVVLAGLALGAARYFGSRRTR